jgi:hypothetical protein
MSNRILSYKGQLADQEQETILLTTKKGEIGYRIIKLQAIAAEPGSQSQESVIKVYADEQTSILGTIDFSDNRLLGVVYYRDNNNDIYPTSSDIIFDKEIFNQDIYISHFDVAAGQSCNYYLELEAIKLDESQALVASLKDIRNNQ